MAGYVGGGDGGGGLDCVGLRVVALKQRKKNKKRRFESCSLSSFLCCKLYVPITPLATRVVQRGTRTNTEQTARADNTQFFVIAHHSFNFRVETLSLYNMFRRS